MVFSIVPEALGFESRKAWQKSDSLITHMETEVLVTLLKLWLAELLLE